MFTFSFPKLFSFVLVCTLFLHNIFFHLFEKKRSKLDVTRLSSACVNQHTGAASSSSISLVSLSPRLTANLPPFRLGFLSFQQDKEVFWENVFNPYYASPFAFLCLDAPFNHVVCVISCHAATESLPVRHDFTTKKSDKDARILLYV